MSDDKSGETAVVVGNNVSLVNSAAAASHAARSDVATLGEHLGGWCPGTRR